MTVGLFRGVPGRNRGVSLFSCVLASARGGVTTVADDATETLSALSAFDRREARRGVVFLDGVSVSAEVLFVANLRIDMLGRMVVKGDRRREGMKRVIA